MSSDEQANRMINSSSEERHGAAIGGRISWTRCAVLGAVCALVIGVYAWSANSGVLELFGLGAQDSYYNLLVQGFRAGQLNVKREAPPALAQPGVPSGPGIHAARWMNAHGIHDLSYYKGKLYLYFGITPALVLFWPYAVLTGHYLLHKDAVVIFFSVGFLASAGLLCAVWRRYFAETGFWLVGAGALALGLANFIPEVLQSSDVYEVAISCGYAMTMLALVGIWGALHDSRRPWRWLAAASLAYGLGVGARPSLLLGAVILLVPVAQAWQEKRRVWPLLLAASGPIVLIGLGLMFYNALRFDNPLEFGQRYQLPMSAHQQFSLGYLWFNFRVGFLEPARWSGVPPFVNDIAPPAFPRGYFIVEHPFGVLTNIPLVWLALTVPLVWRSRSAEGRSTLRWFVAAVVLLFGICALTIILHDSMCLRYEVEFTHELVLLAVIGILGLERALAGRPVWRRAARCGWGLLLIFSLAFNLFASFELQAIARANLGYVFAQYGRIDEEISQYQKSIEIKPGWAEIHGDLGNALLQKGRIDEAMIQFQKVLKIKPNDAKAHFNLGNALLQKGKVDEAITYYQSALQIEPDDAEVHGNLGNALLQKGRIDEAITQFQRVLQINPDDAKAHHRLGATLFQKGKVDEAISDYQRALQIEPGDAEGYGSLGNALQQKGKMDEAITQYQKALQIQPANPEFQNNLAWLLATCPQAPLRNGNKAVELARQANEIAGGKNPFFLDTLAAAYAEAGRFSEAVETAQRALRLAEGQSNARLAGQLQVEMKLYQAGKPYRDEQ